MHILAFTQHLPCDLNRVVLTWNRQYDYYLPWRNLQSTVCTIVHTHTHTQEISKLFSVWKIMTTQQLGVLDSGNPYPGSYRSRKKHQRLLIQVFSTGLYFSLIWFDFAQVLYDGMTWKAFISFPQVPLPLQLTLWKEIRRLEWNSFKMMLPSGSQTWAFC